MGIDNRSSHGLRQPLPSNTSLPAHPESPSSLPDTFSQNSTSSQTSTTSWSQTAQQCPQAGANIVPAEQRQNPRRSNSGPTKPPTLVRQDERKVSFVDSLVDSATQMVEVIWPLSVAPPPCRPNTSGVLSLRRYIEETLRRSRTSYSTLQVALYYLVLIMPLVPKCDFTREQLSDSPCMRSLQCGRRMFLAALILASKYLQDRNYSAKAWSKMSGLKVAEINMNERAFLQSVNWKLHIPDNIFKRWTDVVLRYTPSQSPPSPGHAIAVVNAKATWREIIPLLTPELDTVAVVGTPVVATPEPVAAHTPFASLPSFLEPELDVAPPTPAFVGTVASLPTPRSTPPRSFTPAVSVTSVESWPVMRAPLRRRPSTMSSDSSLGSSPESTFSDASRLSRSSSISSVSTSVMSVSSEPSVSAQACLAKLATYRSTQMYSQSMPQMMHSEPAHGQPVVVLNDELMASPISIIFAEDKPFTAEDAPLSRASRAVKRSYSERSEDDDEDELDSALQFNVRNALKAQPSSMPVILEDNTLPRSSCDLQSSVSQMFSSSHAVLGGRKRVCVSAH